MTTSTMKYINDLFDLIWQQRCLNTMKW
jgi:hypothetical protein